MFRREERARGWALLPVCFVFAVALQYFGGAYQAELSGYPDESPHFVTGVMMKDYISTFPPPPPFEFAKNYYVHRPKVAIGHWPPMFYLVEGAWFLVFGASRISALLLMASIAAAMATTLGFIVRSRFGAWAGYAAGLAFLSLPYVQLQTQEVMADMLVGVWGLWATLALIRYIEQGRRRDLFEFAGLAVLAIFTKGNGLYLALLPPIALLFTKRLRLLLDPYLWLAAALAGVPSVAWVWLTSKFVTDTWVGGFSAAFAFGGLWKNATFLWPFLGPAFLVLIGAGLFTRLVQPLMHGSPEPLWGGLGAAATSVYLFQSVVPAGLEPRFLVPAAAALVPFLFAGAESLTAALPARWPAKVRFATILIAAGLVFTAQSFAVPHKRHWGFKEAADFLVSQPDAHGAAILVSSQIDGEGMLISELTMREKALDGYILRASQVLSRSDWLGRDYSARFNSVDELQQYLNRIGVDFVVVDETGGLVRPHHRLLIEALSQSHDWQLVENVPRDVAARKRDYSIRIYRRIGPKFQPDQEIRAEMEQVLRRRLN